MNNHPKFSKSIVCTLLLTGLLNGEIYITENTALAIPKSQQIQISQNILPRNISDAVIRDASTRSKLKISDLSIFRVTPRTFSNRCIFEFKERCTKEYKPIQGWVIVVKAKDRSLIYHVSQSSEIVIDPSINFDDGLPLPKSVEQKIITDAANRAGVSNSSVKISSSKQKIFANSCVFNFGEVCVQVYQPVTGWAVVVKVKDELWTYHVDQSGSQIVIDPKLAASLRG